MRLVSRRRNTEGYVLNLVVLVKLFIDIKRMSSPAGETCSKDGKINLFCNHIVIDIF